jgi:protein-S-isoprenylcysteine O-methyltransferase Ste14
MSRLPSLGRRGEGWVILQGVLLVAVVLTGLAGSPWPEAARTWLVFPAGLIAAAGAYLLVAGGAGLGHQLTPFPKPVTGGGLRQDGAYRLVRHPMYGGALLLVFAWALVSSPLALVPWALALTFLDAKRRREEAWLLEQHPDYEDFRRRVRARLLPLVW